MKFYFFTTWFLRQERGWSAFWAGDSLIFLMPLLSLPCSFSSFTTTPPNGPFSIPQKYPELPLAPGNSWSFPIDSTGTSAQIYQVSNTFSSFSYSIRYFLFLVPASLGPPPTTLAVLSTQACILQMTLLFWFISWLVHILNFGVFLASYLCYSLGLWVVLFTLVLIFNVFRMYELIWI